MAHPDLTDTTHPSLSFDGCGINGRDQYRSRIATFTDKRGPVAQKYGPLFAASEEMREALKECITSADASAGRSHALAMRRLEYINTIAKAALAKAEGKS